MCPEATAFANFARFFQLLKSVPLAARRRPSVVCVAFAVEFARPAADESSGHAAGVLTMTASDRRHSRRRAAARRLALALLVCSAAGCQIPAARFATGTPGATCLPCSVVF